MEERSEGDGSGSRALEGRQHLREQRRVVDGDRVAGLDPHRGGSAVGLGDLLGAPREIGVHCLAHPRVEGPDGADQARAARDDVVAYPGLEPADGRHRRLPPQVEPARDDGLHRGDDLARLRGSEEGR